LAWGAFLWTLTVSILPMDAALAGLGRGVTESHSAVLWALGALLFLGAASVAFRHRVAAVLHPPAMRPADVRRASPQP